MIHVAGAVLVIVGVCLRAWALVHLHRAGLTTVAQLAYAAPPPGVYATRGPYRLTRHPMYVGSFLIFCGAAVAVTGWWQAACLVGLAIFPHYNHRIILEDEQRRLAEAVRGARG